MQWFKWFHGRNGKSGIIIFIPLSPTVFSEWEVALVVPADTGTKKLRWKLEEMGGKIKRQFDSSHHNDWASMNIFEILCHPLQFLLSLSFFLLLTLFIFNIMSGLYANENRLILKRCLLSIYDFFVATDSMPASFGILDAGGIHEDYQGNYGVFFCLQHWQQTFSTYTLAIRCTFQNQYMQFVLSLEKYKQMKRWSIQCIILYIHSDRIF